MSRIARNSVNGRLNRKTFCSGAEVVPVQCKRGRSLFVENLYDMSRAEYNCISPQSAHI